MPTGEELADDTPLESAEHLGFDNGLRVLFYPMISASNMIEASPTYCRFKQLMRWYEENYDFPIYWHVVWPDVEAEGMRYRYKWNNMEEKAWLNSHPRVELIKCRFHATQSTDTSMCSREFREAFNIAEGNRFFDVIWNQKVQCTPYIMDQVVSRRGHDDILPPCVNTLQMYPTKDKMFSEWSQLKFSSGLVGPSVHTVWESDHEIKETMKELRHFFNHDTIQKFKNRSTVVEPGIDVDYIDKVTEGIERQKSPKIISMNGKIYNDRNYKEAFKIMDQAYASKYDVDLQIVTPGLSATAATAPANYSQNIDHFDVYTGLSKEKYLKQSAKASIMVNSVVKTDFNQTMGEVVYANALPVVRDGNWSRLMFGEDYPFLYRGEKHGKKMLLYVLANFDEIYEEWHPKLCARMRDRFHSARYFKEILEQWSRLREEVTWGAEWYDLPDYPDRYTEQNRRKKALLKALRHVDDEFTMEDFRDAFKQIADNNTDILDAYDGRAPAPHLRFYWALKKYGVKDTCEGPTPTLEKGHLDKI